MAQCFQCGEAITLKDKPQRSDHCVCGAPVHACVNCRFYERSARHECREPQAEWVREKNIANFCGWLELSDRSDFESRKKATDAGKNTFDTLFK